MADFPVPQAGLRPPGVRVRNKSNDIIRASVVVPAGDEIETSDYVAGQLVGQSGAFEIVAGVWAGAGDDPESEAEPPAASDSGVEEAGGGSARRRGGRRG